ncbi:AMP-dependent synthetase [Streptomyces abyssalis]|uniref:AMP-dependent synthetase n=1 Tax=Streptomyces abyssalis TaxID=933944 RepID=A0A1E7JKM1_9ACTN|nr:AMP-binding protein [Streptomyces abyssalis]OEU88186.1 AMP-dependent synthetase [Streptomyces abyssalis]OEU91057.1 AMP-dependent synthetase [Streptomyces abyssalis]OEV09399.1 AMP-dependent synthetase [Streptomyces nanshensis]
MPVQSLAELVRFVRRNSSFYASLYSGLPDRVKELTELPVIPQTEFWQANNPRGNTLLTGPLDEAVVFKSGGTTGAPKFSFYTRDEWNEFTTAFGAGLVEAGLRPGQRVADLFYTGDLYASFTFILDALHRAPVANVRLPIGGAAPLDSTVGTLEQFDVEVIAGTPTTLCSLAEHLRAGSRRLPHVTTLFFGGESIFSDQQRLLATAFPNARVASVGYAAVDAGLVGAAVPGGDPRLHRAFTPHTVVEILDEHSGEPVTRAGVPGRVVVTDLRRRLMPVLRYPVGDRAEWTDTAAGHFRILGRAEEGLRVGPVALHTQDVHDLVRSADPAGRITGLQLVVRRWEDRDGLVLRLGSDLRDEDLPELTAAVDKAFRAARPMYAAAVAARHVHPMAVEWVRHADLAVNSRSGKLIRAIDERPHA